MITHSKYRHAFQSHVDLPMFSVENFIHCATFSIIDKKTGSPISFSFMEKFFEDKRNNEGKLDGVKWSYHIDKSIGSGIVLRKDIESGQHKLDAFNCNRNLVELVKQMVEEFVSTIGTWCKIQIKLESVCAGFEIVPTTEDLSIHEEIIKQFSDIVKYCAYYKGFNNINLGLLTIGYNGMRRNDILNIGFRINDVIIRTKKLNEENFLAVDYKNIMKKHISFKVFDHEKFNKLYLKFHSRFDKNYEQFIETIYKRIYDKKLKDLESELKKLGFDKSLCDHNFSKEFFS